MSAQHLMIASLAGAIALAICAVLWAVIVRRQTDGDLVRLQKRTSTVEAEARLAQAAVDAFESALLTWSDGTVQLASGSQSLANCARLLGLTEVSPDQVLTALSGDFDHARRLTALLERGESCAFEVQGKEGSVLVEGRAVGALVWLRLSTAIGDDLLPSAARFAALLDARPHPVWLAKGDGTATWANQAWLAAVGAASATAAAMKGLSFDRSTEALGRDVATSGERQTAQKWVTVSGQRRAFQVEATPLDGGGVGFFADDVSALEEIKESLRRHVEAHDETLNHLANGVAIFGQTRRLAFHNTAFAELWGLEPAWLAERPSHGEVLDRLRQRRRLPETADYGAWRAAELSRYELLSASDELWTLPDGRTLRVLHQPHPMGGLLLLFEDMTGEFRLKAQYNAMIKVQQATLDKLSDAVAVFGADGRLRLHNEAFPRFWGASPGDIAAAGDFEGVVQLCVRRLHDLQFWRELKGRVADPDPQARAPMSGEVRSADDRIVAWQSRPLPDGATLIAFSDITDTRQLEGALADRSAALEATERLKRDFVGNVSYELRTPLTTILGYAQMLEALGDAIPDRGKTYIAAVRSAADQLAGSINDILHIAAIDADEVALDLADVSITGLIQSVHDYWLNKAEQAGITLQLESSDVLDLIRADEARLRQVFDHLVENALRHTPRGGTVTLSATQDDHAIKVSVADTGRGIAYHVQAKIFDRFSGRDGGGPGLGLALVKALVELHGGWVDLVSEPGNGAVFTCHLPGTARTGSDLAPLDYVYNLL